MAGTSPGHDVEGSGKVSSHTAKEISPHFRQQPVTVSLLSAAGIGRGVGVTMGTMMVSSTRYRQYAADCVRQAQGETTAEDKTIMLNVALAWLRLAQQSEANDAALSPPLAPEPVDLDETPYYNFKTVN
jgi:Holliday junction resolvasome RuvABC endonuclease subunit